MCVAICVTRDADWLQKEEELAAARSESVDSDSGDERDSVAKGLFLPMLAR